MPCDKPLRAYQIRDKKNANGKAIICFKPPNNPFDPISLACGRCIGCRLERSKIWAARCMHETTKYEDNYFVTLTYNDDHLPSHGSLYPRHLTLFFKRLRKAGHDVRYYACGEYGDSTRRCHYHAIIFNLRLDDLVPYSYNGGNRLYTSELLQGHWHAEGSKEPLGNVYIGNVSFESCAYVARYILKKQLGPNALEYYCTYDIHTGEIFTQREPEFVRMSRGRKRGQGIGADYFQKYHTQMYGQGGQGTVVLRGGVTFNTPRYYDNLYESINLERLEEIKQQRRKKAEKTKQTSRSRKARRILRDQKIQSLTRKLE